VSQDAGNDDPADRGPVGRWYASSFEVGHNAFEFSVDCGQDEFMTVFLRIITSPFNARELFRELGMSLLRYSDRFGPIDENGAPEERK
jgi:hypothetical protein